MKLTAAVAFAAAVPLVAFAHLGPTAEPKSPSIAASIPQPRGVDFGVTEDFIVTADRDAVLRNAAAAADPRG